MNDVYDIIFNYICMVGIILNLDNCNIVVYRYLYAPIYIYIYITLNQYRET